MQNNCGMWELSARKNVYAVVRGFVHEYPLSGTTMEVAVTNSRPYACGLPRRPRVPADGETLTLELVEDP
jgi:hypothetical protein